MVINTIPGRQFVTQIQRATLLMLLIFTAAYASLGTTPAQASANITVSTSRNPVSLDDSFQLIYEVNSGFFSGDVDDDPDFSPIDKDFDILSSSQTMSSSYINGTWKQTKAWKLTVIAKDVGKFTIPPIHFGSDVSPAIQITITSSSSANRAAPNAQATIPAKIFLETFMDKKQGWIQSQFIFTVRLLRTVSIASASLTEPVTNDSDAITKLIDESQYQTTRNGIRYEVIERRYAIFPQKSGTLKISPLTFEGRVNPTQARTIFDQFRMSGQLKRLRSKPVSVEVKPAPSNINLQDWLPAKDVQLSEEWSGDIHNIKTGEPITRTITIMAEGLSAVQLPELTFAEIDGLKQYPDKGVSENREDRNGITAIKQFKVALIPGKAGDYTLPAINLEWWNTRTDKMETATIPQQTITANGVSSTSYLPPVQQPAPAVAPPVTQGPNAGTGTENPAISESTHPESAASTEAPYWKWLALVSTLAWLLTLFILLKRPKADNVKPKTEISSLPLKKAYSAVVKHASNDDARRSRSALIDWAKVAYSDDRITNLTQVSEHTSPQLAQAIRQLNQTLYSQDHLSWGGDELLHLFKQEPVEHEKRDASTLKPLYNS